MNERERNEQTKHIPVILFSAHLSESSPMETCGADDFLVKPFRRKELLDIVAGRINPTQQSTDRPVRS